MLVHLAFKFLNYFTVKIYTQKAILICDNKKLIYLIKMIQVNQIKFHSLHICLYIVCISYKY